jgi:catecholate siderophore receptor
MKKSQNRPLMLAAALFHVTYAEGAELDKQTRQNVPVLPEVKVDAIVDTESDYKIDEVSSLKFTAPLIDTPQTVSVIPKTLFLQQGAQNLTEVLRNTPGITFSAGENGFGSNTSNFSMRGFDTTGSIFIDNVRDSGNYSRDIFNLEQVEVVKGPAADNGRGTAGGYINLVTKTPHEVAAINGLLNFGVDEYDSKVRGRMNIDVNQPFLGTGAVRLNAMWQDGGVPGRAVTEKQSWGLAPSIAFGLGTPTRFIASYQHTEQDDIPDWGVPAAMIKDMMRFDSTLDTETLRDKFYGLTADYDRVSADAVMVRIEHDFSPDLRLSNQTRWSQTDRTASYTMPTGYTDATQLVTTQRQAYGRENLSISNLTNLSASFLTGMFRHNVSTGVEFAHEESDSDRFGTQNNPGTGAPINIYHPDPNRAGLSTLRPTQTSKVEIDSIAGYAYDTMEITKQWQVTGGLRVEHYRVKLDSRAADGSSLLDNDYDQDRTTANGKLGLVYKPVKNGSIYVAAGVSALPPASFLSNPDISREGDNAFPGFSTGMNSADAKNQYSVNYEIGTK